MGFFFYFSLLETSKEAVIHVWVDIVLEIMSQQEERRPQEQQPPRGPPEIGDGLGVVTGYGPGELSCLTQILRARETPTADAGCTDEEGIILRTEVSLFPGHCK